LNLGYPGGPAIEQIAYSGNWTKFYLPRPLIDSPDFDFSFSGLKTAVVNLVDRLAVGIKNPKYHNKRKIPNNNSPNPMVADLASSIQEAVVDVLVSKAIKAANKFNVENIVLGGGVAANKRLREEMASRFRGTVYFSSPNLAIDNAAMVAAAAFFNYQPVSWRKVTAEAGILI